MEHVAIMNKSWGLTEKILRGQKTIESRWYKAKYAPWNRIQAGEIIYFKNAGEPVTISAIVDRVLYFSDLTPGKVEEILVQYGQDAGIEEEKTPEFVERFKSKRYCMLIFLKDVQPVVPFEIDKHGFGSMSSWLCVDSVNRLTQGERSI
jgi:ASC-1-like (ASCH) protein